MQTYKELFKIIIVYNIIDLDDVSNSLGILIIHFFS
jgi:hypothetical protein